MESSPTLEDSVEGKERFRRQRSSKRWEEKCCWEILNEKDGLTVGNSSASQRSVLEMDEAGTVAAWSLVVAAQEWWKIVLLRRRLYVKRTDGQ